jgi:hypothetical protein
LLLGFVRRFWRSAAKGLRSFSKYQGCGGFQG